MLRVRKVKKMINEYNRVGSVLRLRIRKEHPFNETRTITRNWHCTFSMSSMYQIISRIDSCEQDKYVDLRAFSLDAVERKHLSHLKN